MFPAKAKLLPLDQQRLIREKMLDPLYLIENYARVKNFDSKDAPARFEAIDDLLREHLTLFLAEPDREADPTAETTWVCEAKARQTGRSTNYELAGLALMMERRDWLHICVADKDDRAKKLHDRMHYAYNRWPEDVRTPKLTAKERLQLTLDPKFGGKAITLSAQNPDAGIGLSPDSFHWSEVGYCENFELTWAKFAPSLLQRPLARVVLECTPTAAGSPWHTFYVEQKKNKYSRFQTVFTPFQASKVSRRPWHPDWKMDGDELKLMERYGGAHHRFPLTMEHLAFRRHTLNTVPEFRRDPDLFRQEYPFDDVTCWRMSTGSIIPPSALEWHTQQPMHPWVKNRDDYKEFLPPETGHTYVIGVDPPGLTTRDHASFHIFRINEGSWEQVAVYSDHEHAERFVQIILDCSEKYNRARIYCENNGPGAATIKLIETQGAGGRLWYQKPGIGGWNNNTATYDRALGWLITFLREQRIRIHDSDTIEQLQTYSHDKVLEGSVKQHIAAQMKRKVNHRPTGRDKHHWDKVSALLSVMWGLTQQSAPPLHGAGQSVKPASWYELTYNERVAYREEIARSKKLANSRRGVYRRLRRAPSRR